MSSRSLGQLTIDLVARTGGFTQGMSKAERDSKKWRREVEKNLKDTEKQLKAGLTVAAAAASAAIVGLSAATVKYTRDGLSNVDAQAKLARSLDTTYDSVTALNIAFSEGGVDGFESSLNRLNRRLGAAEAGTGAAAKTVEALGLNLKELSGLEADERIARIADAIVDSGVSAQRAARFVQDLGFEQREAAQLFLQGGDTIRAYRQQVDDFGLSLSAIDAAKVEQANDSFARTGRLTDAISQQLAVQFAPILSAVSEMLVQSAKDAGGLESATADAFNMVIDAAAGGVDAVAEMDRQFLRTKAALDIFALQIRNGFLEIAREIVEIPTGAVNELIGLLNKVGANIEPLGLSTLGREVQNLIDGTNAEIETINDNLRQELEKPLPGSQFQRFVSEARTAAEESAKAFVEANEKISGISTGGASDGEDLDDSLARRRDAIRQSFETEKQTILRIFGEQQEEIRALEEAGALSQMETDNLKMQSEQAMFEKLQEMRERDLQRQQDYENARKALVLGGAEQLFGSMAELTEQFAGKQNALYKVMFAAQKAAAIAQSVVAIQTGLALAAANPWPANLGAIASVAAATAGIVGNIQSVALTGMAHDGLDSVPQTGTWLLEKGERVTTAETSAKLDATLNQVLRNTAGGGSGTTVNVIEDSSRAGQTETQRGSNGEEEVNVFVADIMGGGRRAQAIQTAFGLRRQGN